MTTTDDRKDDHAPAPKPPHHDQYMHVETLDHLGLVHDKDDHLTPVDILFKKEAAADKPKHEPREFL